MISLILTIAGLALLFWNRKVSKLLYELQRPNFKFFFKEAINYEESWVPTFLRIWVIVMGILCLVGAIAFKFGPITVSL